MLEKVLDLKTNLYNRLRPEKSSIVFIKRDTEFSKNFEIKKIINKKIFIRRRIRYLLR